MTVYVDSLIEWGAPGKYPNAQAERVGARHGHRWCHMVSDQRAWFQGDHYDLVPPKRALALQLGALEADRKTIVGIFKANRVLRLRCKGCGFVVTVKKDEKAPEACPSCGRTAGEGGSHG